MRTRSFTTLVAGVIAMSCFMFAGYGWADGLMTTTTQQAPEIQRSDSENSPGSQFNMPPFDFRGGLLYIPNYQTDSIGGWMGVAWPFGSDANLTDWKGWQGDRTGGGAWHGCGRTNTHSGADYYARDLRRSGCSGVVVYAGFAGKVVKAAWTDCYGKCVVIYDSARHVALRYAHLSNITVSAGQSVCMGMQIGNVGDTGCKGGGGVGYHLHLAGYEHINDNNGSPIIPLLCDSDYYACAVYFYCWQ